METSQRLIEMVASFVLGVTIVGLSKQEVNNDKPHPKLFELIRFFNNYGADRFAEMNLVEIIV